MSFRLVDVHCHLESPELADGLDVHLENAARSGVIHLVTASVTPAEWGISLGLKQRYPQVKCALGIHPWYATEKDIEHITELHDAVKWGAIAIGEIGLDRKIDTPDFDLQLDVFERQMRIAIALDLPVVVHCRGAFNELISSVKKTGMPGRGGIIHAFSGSAELARSLIALGFSFSMGGTLTYRASGKRRSVLDLIYPDYFMLETDAPDIPPVQKPERPNVPGNILYNLEGASRITGIPEEEIARQTTKNAEKFFRFNTADNAGRHD